MKRKPIKLADRRLGVLFCGRVPSPRDIPALLELLNALNARACRAREEGRPLPVRVAREMGRAHACLGVAEHLAAKQKESK